MQEWAGKKQQQQQQETNPPNNTNSQSHHISLLQVKHVFRHPIRLHFQYNSPSHITTN